MRGDQRMGDIRNRADSNGLGGKFRVSSQGLRWMTAEVRPEP